MTTELWVAAAVVLWLPFVYLTVLVATVAYLRARVQIARTILRGFDKETGRGKATRQEGEA